MQVFIAPPSRDALRARLVGRGTDDAEQVERRLRVAEEELAAAGEFEHVVVNDRLEDAVEELEAIVAAALRDGVKSGEGRAHRPARSARGWYTRDMISPRIDKLLDHVDSNYASVLVAAKRARQINSYYHNLGEGTFDEFPPPMVDTAPRTT